MSSIKPSMNWGSSFALSTISRQRAISLLISSLLCSSPIVAFGVSPQIDQSDPNAIKINFYFSWDDRVSSDTFSISSILGKNNIDRNGRRVILNLSGTTSVYRPIYITDADHPFLEGFDSKLGDEVNFRDELNFSGTLIQAEGFSWKKSADQELTFGVVKFANVKNDFKGKIKANTMYIGNGGNAKDTELGGFTLVRHSYANRPGYLMINFNNESEYELMESSKGGRLNSGRYYQFDLGPFMTDDWEEFETRPGLHIIGTGVTRVTAQHYFQGPTIVHNGTLQFEDNGHIYTPPYYANSVEYNLQNPSIYTGKENVGTVSYKISEGQKYQPEVSVYGYGDVKKQGKGQVTFDNSDVKMTSLEPHWVKLYFTNEMADWLDDYDPISNFDPRFYPGSRTPITDESWASKAEGVYEYWAEYKTPGQHNYYGKTLIEGGTLLLEKNNILVNTAEVQVHSLDQTEFAKFHLKGLVNDNADVVLGKGADPNSSNSFIVDGTSFNGFRIKQGSQSQDHIFTTVELTNFGTLNFNSSGEVFTGFDTNEANGEDRIEIGDKGAILQTNGDAVVTQASTAALSDRSDLKDYGSLIKAGTGTFVINARNRYQGKLKIQEGVLQLGTNGSSQDQVLGGKGDVEIQSETATLRINLSDRYVLLGDSSENRILVGKGNLEQVGSGTTVVDKDHSYEGWTVISGGTLEVMHTGELGHSDKPIITGREAKNGVLAFNEADTQTRTWSRSITGTGSVEKIGAGTLELTNNANDFTGGVTVKSGTLRVASTAPLGTHDTVTIGSTSSEATLEVANSTHQSLDRHLKGNGTLLKTQPGTLELSPVYKYEHKGATSVREGELVLLTGSHVPNSNVEVTEGSLRVQDGVHNVGGISLETGSTTVIHATNLETYGQLTSKADGKLGGKLFVDVSEWATEDDFKGPKLANVIKSETSLTGSKFLSYEDNSALFNFVPEYHYGDQDGQVMHLVVRAEKTPLIDPQSCGKNVGVLECIVRTHGHDKAVPEARVLDKEFETHPDSLISQQFYTLEDDDKADAAAVAALPLMTGSLNSVMQNRVERLSSYGYDAQIGHAKTQDDGSNLWVNVDQNYSRQNADHGATGWTDNTTELALGRDVPVLDGEVRLGFMASYATGEVKSKGTSADHRADVEIFQLGLYGKHHMDTVDLAFRAGYAFAKIDGERRLNWVNKTAKSDTHADILYAGVKVSKPMAWVSPFASLDTHWVRSSGYQEQGAGVLDLDVLKQTRQSAVLMGGVDFQKSLKEGRFNVAATAGLGVELLDTHNEIDAAFRGLPGQYFTTESADRGRLSGKLAFKVNYQVTENTSLSAGYQLDWREGFQSQTGNVKMEIAF